MTPGRVLHVHAGNIEISKLVYRELMKYRTSLFPVRDDSTIEDSVVPCKIFMVMSEKDAQAAFGLGFREKTVTSFGAGAFAVDYHSTPLPAIKKGEDVLEKWKEIYEMSLPLSSQYILRRKVAPEMVAGKHCYEWGSAHAWDVLVSTLTPLCVAEGVYSDISAPGPDIVQRQLVKLTESSLETLQHKDNRRKTEYYQVGVRPTVIWR